MESCHHIIYSINFLSWLTILFNPHWVVQHFNHYFMWMKYYRNDPCQVYQQFATKLQDRPFCYFPGLVMNKYFVLAGHTLWRAPTLSASYLYYHYTFMLRNQASLHHIQTPLSPWPTLLSSLINTLHSVQFLFCRRETKEVHLSKMRTCLASHNII